MIQFECSHCRKPMKCVGDRPRVRCPHCSQVNDVPSQELDLESLVEPQPVSELFEPPVEQRASVNVPLRFRNCRRYVAILTMVTKITTALLALLPFPFLIGALFVFSNSHWAPESVMSLAFVAIASLAWWAVLAWGYICSMCGIELIQAVVEVEHNTRESSRWLDRIANAK